METVWLNANGRDWHVVVGSPEHEHLLNEGAEPTDDPTAAKKPKPSKPKAAKADDGLNMNELRKQAKERGITVPVGTRKADLAAMLAQPVPDSESTTETLGE